MREAHTIDFKGLEKSKSHFSLKYLSNMIRKAKLNSDAGRSFENFLEKSMPFWLFPSNFRAVI